MDRNPEFAQVLNNPQQLQEAMQAASNPVSAAACCKAPESIGSTLLQNWCFVNLTSHWCAASVQGVCVPSALQGFQCIVSAACQASTHFSASPLSQLIISLEADTVAFIFSALCKR